MKRLSFVVLLSFVTGCAAETEGARSLATGGEQEDAPARATRSSDVVLRPEQAGAIVLDTTADGGMGEPSASGAEAGAAEPASIPEAEPPPPFAIESSNGAATTVDGASERCSGDGEPATFTLTNQRAQPVTLFWLDATCALLAYGTVAPGATIAQETYATHRWRVADATTTHDFILETPGAHYRITTR